MKFTNLRLIGFKSFVEPADFEIREGLTGIVGPNGCGKSNILESLRWVMGATSAKALRGAGMEDVIFAGTSMRPARNWAEVVLTLDNADRSAPAEYNDIDTLEISRRILKKEDGSQSVYRINNKEVRAKDVQLVFADASTGANSPSLVRQGQVAELISAKPQNRRRLLEEAAGITGIHSRRHEAELRLRATEQNLERLEDVIAELETQRAALARQARQATRYRNVSGDIRRAEAMAAYLRWKDAKDDEEEAACNLNDVAGLVENTAREAAAASTAQAEAHDALDPLRIAEAEAAAALHRLTVAREGLDEESRRAANEVERLEGEIAKLSADIERENGLLTDAEDAVETLNREEENLRTREASEADRLAAAAESMKATAEALDAAERAFEAKSSEAAEFDARRRAVANAIDQAQQRLQKVALQITALEEERAEVEPTPEQARALAEAQARFAAAENSRREAEAAFHCAEEERTQAQEREAALRTPRQEAEQNLSEIRAERDGLKRILDAHEIGDWKTLIEEVDVRPGFETALATVLGDDLSASVDSDAPAHWSAIGKTPVDLHLPDDAAPLSRYVKAPSELARRLAAIGVVEREAGARLQASLKPGQRLVSREGDLWRWDGYIARAEVKAAAAIRLEQRNRLQAIDADIAGSQSRATHARSAHETAAEELTQRQARERVARTALADAARTLDEARAQLTEIQHAHERASTRIASIDENLDRLRDDHSEATRALDTLREESVSLPEQGAINEALLETRSTLSQARARASEARAAHNDLAREAEMRAERLDVLSGERGVWTSRTDTARSRINELETRLEETRDALDNARAEPARIEERRRALLDQIGVAETRRAEAGDALAAAAERAQQADRTAKAADAAAAEARETRARIEAQAEAARARVEEAVLTARETCEAGPENLLEIAGHKEGKELPSRDEIDRKLERYKRERENLGGVNLRADEEMREVAERLDELSREREDCDAAIRKLRAAISGLNREARQRLLDSFETVNANFSKLFTTLFNGGHAEMRLVDSEDPLDAGLEIFASPPGKKLASMSLMSGGEQALTATALIFAVFMANPAPICVLDEVDAPLDDVNVERFCRLLHEMVQQTETRFIIITHHALTMSRMDRLFGVTMIERGVSQLVSVDLTRAEQLAAE
ncbi:MAG: chromosome segregation protein SMC [Parvularculaceae bacterium]